ncbi:MAG: class I SAM-dependent methyltransferase [Clostridia bacterium]|nr:class I SAM-dependent methyltransferase [Clostridia bacterium]
MKLEELDKRLLALRTAAREVRDPTAADETLEYLLHLLETREIRSILEIGAAEGLTSCALLSASQARLTAIELDSGRAKRAREHFEEFGFTSRVVLHEGDAGEILRLLKEEYDLIFLYGT